MNIQVTRDKVCIIEKENIHKGEYKINELTFDFSDEYTSDLVISAVFTNELGKAYQVSVIDGKCHIPAEILADTGQVVLGVYAYQINGEELELRYSPFPTSFVVLSGSYNPTAEESQEITPTQYEQYMQALQDGLNQVQASISELDNATKNANDLVDEINKKLENGDFIGPQGPIGPQGEPGKDGTNGIDGVGITTITSGQATEENGNTITPITVEKTDGSSETFNVSAKNGIDGKNGQNGKDGINGTNGIDGQDGITPNIQIGTVETLEPTEEATVTRTGTDEEPLLNFGIPKGDKGDPGETPDLSNYVQNTDYATYDKAGVLRANSSGFNVGTDGIPRAEQYNLENYNKIPNNTFISKGTLENIKDDYVGTSEPINVLNDTLDNVIPKQTTTDSIINVNDALKYKAFDFKVDGAYEQNGEPTPETPIPITTLIFDKITKIGQNQPYQETNYLIDLQGNEMVGLPNGVKDELTIDKESNVSLIKRIGKKIINEADLNGINDTWFTLIDYLRLNKPNDYIGYNKVDLSNSYNNTLLNKFYRSPKETPRETYDDVYSIIEYQATSSFALTIPKGTTLEQAREMTAGTIMYYELAEPQTISLGKLSDIITTEQGSNTFAINGNIDTQISTTYALDLKKYIDNKIAAISSAVLEQE